MEAVEIEEELRRTLNLNQPQQPSSSGGRPKGGSRVPVATLPSGDVQPNHLPNPRIAMLPQSSLSDASAAAAAAAAERFSTASLSSTSTSSVAEAGSRRHRNRKRSKKNTPRQVPSDNTAVVTGSARIVVPAVQKSAVTVEPRTQRISEQGVNNAVSTSGSLRQMAAIVNSGGSLRASPRPAVDQRGSTMVRGGDATKHVSATPVPGKPVQKSKTDAAPSGQISSVANSVSVKSNPTPDPAASANVMDPKNKVAAEFAPNGARQQVTKQEKGTSFTIHY